MKIDLILLAAALLLRRNFVSLNRSSCIMQKKNKFNSQTANRAIHHHVQANQASHPRSSSLPSSFSIGRKSLWRFRRTRTGRRI